MANFLNVAPKKSVDFNITRTKIIYGLIITLAMLGIYKTLVVGHLEKELVDAKAVALISQVSDFSQTKELDNYFTSDIFCGWRLDKAGAVTSSPNFEENAKSAQKFERSFFKDGINQTFSLCINSSSFINSSVERAIIAILFVTVVILALIYTADDDKEEIPTT